MPRDGTETRARIIREAERLFARRGVYQVTVREITEAAGQRNVSAVNYHFGSREGVLHAILVRHGGPLDEERGALLARLGPDASPRELVEALLVPLTHSLTTPEGRDYLRIVAQLSGQFAAWRVEDELRGPNLRRILSMLEDSAPDLPPALRRERVVGIIMLMTSAMAERARALESGRRLALPEATFVANLADMIVGALEVAPRSTLPA